MKHHQAVPIFLLEILEGAGREKRVQKKVSEQIKAEYFPNVIMDMNLHV